MREKLKNISSKPWVQLLGMAIVTFCIIGTSSAYSGSAHNVFENAVFNFSGEESAETMFGGGTSGFYDAAEGYKVDGTVVIDGSGNIDAPITSTTGNYSSTLDVTGDTTLAALDASTLTQGGGVTTISTSSTSYTLTASQIDTENYISFTPTAGAATVTLPATSTLSTFCPNAGDMREIIFENAATAATTTTIATGAGMDLQEPDGQNVVIGQNNFAIIKFWRRSDTDMVVTVDEHIPAD